MADAQKGMSLKGDEVATIADVLGAGIGPENPKFFDLLNLGYSKQVPDPSTFTFGQGFLNGALGPSEKRKELEQRRQMALALAAKMLPDIEEHKRNALTLQITPPTMGTPSNLPDMIAETRRNAPDLASSMTGLQARPIGPPIELALGNETSVPHPLTASLLDQQAQLTSGNLSPELLSHLQDSPRTSIEDYRLGVKHRLASAPPSETFAGGASSLQSITPPSMPAPTAYRAPVAPTPAMLGNIPLSAEIATMLQGKSVTADQLPHLVAGLRGLESTSKGRKVQNVAQGTKMVDEETGQVIFENPAAPKEETQEFFRVQKSLRDMEAKGDTTSPSYVEAKKRMDKITEEENLKSLNGATQYLFPGLKTDYGQLTGKVTAEESANAKTLEQQSGVPSVAEVGMDRTAAAYLTSIKQRAYIAGEYARSKIAAEQETVVPQKDRDEIFDRKAFIESGEYRRAPAGISKGDMARGDFIQITDVQRKALAMMETARGSADTLFTLADSLITATTPLQAGIQFAKLHAGAFAGTNGVAATYLADKQAFSSVQGKAVGGETGVLTNTDIVRWERTLPTFGDTVATKIKKKEVYDHIYNLTARAQRRILAGESPEKVRSDPAFQKTLHAELAKADALETAAPSLPTVRSEADHKALAPGTLYLDPEGKQRMKK